MIEVKHVEVPVPNPFHETVVVPGGVIDPQPFYVHVFYTDSWRRGSRLPLEITQRYPVKGALDERDIERRCDELKAVLEGLAGAP